MPLDAFHDDVVDAILFSYVVECCNMRMIQPGQSQRQRFVPKTVSGVLARQYSRSQDLDCDNAIQLFVLRAIHHAHATDAQLFDQYRRRRVPGPILCPQNVRSGTTVAESQEEPFTAPLFPSCSPSNVSTRRRKSGSPWHLVSRKATRLSWGMPIASANNCCTMLSG